MSDLKDFVSGQNVDRFLDQLGEPLEPERRETLLRLLIEEQDRLGHDPEQLDLARLRVAGGAGRILRMKILAACYPPGSDHGLRASSVVSALEQAQVLIEGRYQQLRAEWLRERLDAADEGPLPSSRPSGAPARPRVRPPSPAAGRSPASRRGRRSAG